MFGEPGILFFLLPILSSALVFLVLLAVVVLLVRPGGPDRRGRRPYAVYLFAVIFVSLFTAVGSVAAVAVELGQQVAPGFGETGPAINAAVIGAVAIAVLALHVREARRLIAKEESGG